MPYNQKIEARIRKAISRWKNTAHKNMFVGVELPITGKPMKRWVMVAQDGFRGDDELRNWLNQAREFVIKHKRVI